MSGALGHNSWLIRSHLAMSFAGASLIRDGKLCPSASATNDVGSASGYHLLVVEGYSRTKADVLNSEYIQSCIFRVGGYLWFLRRHGSPFVRVPPPDMQQHFTDLLMAKEGTDVTFKVGGETFVAHRCVLAARSRVFKAELFGPMKEGCMATAGVIHVEDMEAQAFRAMLNFIYSDSEPEHGKEDADDVVWQHLLAAADRYDLQRLKLMCEDKLCRFIDVNTTTTILALAERHSCDGLKKACYDFLGAPANLKAVATTDGFRHLIRTYPSVMEELIAMLAP
ncbi:unnamed protein product [Alopecurus aequalis]